MASFLLVKHLSFVMSSPLLSKNFKIKIYKTIILPAVLYGCETWSLTLKKKHKLKVFENRVLRRTFGPKMDEIIGGGLRKLHNEEFSNLHSSPNVTKMIKARRMEWAGHVARLGDKRTAYGVLVGSREGKRPLG
jgi:hypothetical protein